MQAGRTDYANIHVKDCCMRRAASAREPGLLTGLIWDIYEAGAGGGAMRPGASPRPYHVSRSPPRVDEEKRWAVVIGQQHTQFKAVN